MQLSNWCAFVLPFFLTVRESGAWRRHYSKSSVFNGPLTSFHGPVPPRHTRPVWTSSHQNVTTSRTSGNWVWSGSVVNHRPVQTSSVGTLTTGAHLPGAAGLCSQTDSPLSRRRSWSSWCQSWSTAEDLKDTQKDKVFARRVFCCHFYLFRTSGSWLTGQTEQFKQSEALLQLVWPVRGFTDDRQLARVEEGWEKFLFSFLCF